MDLIQKFLYFVKKELSSFGVNDFSGLDDQEIIALNLNLKSKMIRDISYVVKESGEVSKKIKNLDIDYQKAYEEIKDKLKKGEDINPFLSKQALNPKRSDYLLYDWKIHHLHLNNKKKSSNYFNERSDFLLMVIFQKNIAHFIDIESHQDDEVFVKREYIRIIHDNWPNVIEPYHYKGVTGVLFEPTNEEIKELRKNHINTHIKIKDKVYGSIGGGITGAGTGTNNFVKAISWVSYIKNLDKFYIENKEKLIKEIFEKTGKNISKLDLEFGYYENQLVLVEKSSSLVLQVLKA